VRDASFEPGPTGDRTKHSGENPAMDRVQRVPPAPQFGAEESSGIGRQNRRGELQSELLCGGNALVGSNQAAAAKVSRVLRRSAAP